MTKTLFDDDIERQFGSPYPDGLAGHHTGAGDTEMAAARDASKTLASGCLDALYKIRMAGERGLTDEEGSTYQFSFPKRRCDLYHSGHVKDSGMRRPSSRGKQMIVWVSTA